MAIQDDNTILNKGDLKAYHEAIAPMLGGTFMVRTNNSDFYSTDEKVVGVWTDGKPIYQKTFVLSSGINITANTWINVNIPLVNAEHVLLCLGYNANGVITLYANPDAVSDAMVIYSGIPLNDVSIFTVQYTKTTDAAGSATTTPGAYDINFPNTWKENTEIYFGNGLYGRRCTGTIASTADMQYIDLVTSLPTTTALVNVGGTLKRHVMGTSYYDFSIPFTHQNLMSASVAVDVGTIKFIVKNSEAGSGVPYDVWVTYTK